MTQTRGARRRILLDAILLAVIVATGMRLLSVGYSGQTSGVPPSHAEAVPLVDVGTRLSLSGLQSGVDRHVILLLDAECRACNDQASFYASLAERIQATSNVDLVVVSPSERDLLARWLDAKGIVGRRIVRLNRPERKGFAVFPTLLIVDRDGAVRDIVERAQPETVHAAILNRVDSADGRPLRIVMRAPERNARQLAQIQRRQLIDVRERHQYEAGRRDGTVNIPIDELAVRAPAELSTSMPVVVDCGSSVIHLCRAAGAHLIDLGFPDVFILVSGSGQ